MATIPIVDDPSESNVVFLKAYVKLSAHPFTPELEAVFQPINFRFNGNPAGYIRPVYLGTRVTLCQRSQKAIRAETQHEIGNNPFNNYSLLFGPDPDNPRKPRLQIFVSASPGHNLHTSPTIGGRRDGIAFGMRMNFRA